METRRRIVERNGNGKVYADLPPGVGFAAKGEPLRRDINLLGKVLGQVIVEQEGKGLFGAEEEIRFLCKSLRFAYDPELGERLRARIERMDGRPGASCGRSRCTSSSSTSRSATTGCAGAASTSPGRTTSRSELRSAVPWVPRE